MTKIERRPFILGAVMLGMFLSAIEATIVATAMPSIVADLGDFSLFSWVFSSYLLTSSATVLLFGKLADIYGRRPIYIFGITIFLLGSTLAGFSTTMMMLIIARFIQGIGAGALMPIAMTIVGDIYTKEERAKIQGYLSSVWGISAIVGPLIGAFFVDFLNWRYVFWMNIPLGILSMIGIILFLKESMRRTKESIDYFGAFFLISGTSLLMVLFVETGDSIKLWSPIFFLIALLTILFLLAFIRHERRIQTPIMPHDIWSIKMIRLPNIVTLLTGMIMISVSSYLPMFVQVIMGESALIAGFSLTAMSIGWPLASTIAGRILLKIGFRLTSLIGGCFLIVGTFLFILLPVIQHVVWAGFASFFVGVGMGMTSTSFIVAIQTTVPWEIRGIATASNTFMRSFGSAIGVALLSGMLNSTIYRYIERAQLTDSISLNTVDRLLEGENLATLSTYARDTLYSGLLSGLQLVYISIGVIALCSFYFIFRLPKYESDL